MVISVKKLAAKAKIKSPDLLTRAVGRTMFRYLLQSAGPAAEGEVVVLDFEGFQVLDSSFIDEFIVKFIISSAGEKRFYVKLRNISDMGQINIESVFRSYRNFDSRRFNVVTEEPGIGSNFCLGDLSSREADVLGFIRTNRSAVPKDVAVFSGIDEDQAEILLKSMDLLGLIRCSLQGSYLSV